MTAAPRTRCRVVGRQVSATDVVLLRLESADGGALPDWSPGAHVDLVLGPRLVRPYSLCGDPADGESWSVAVLRDPASRGGSSHVHDVVQVGDDLEVVGPRNNFELVDSPHYLFLAGGIGITPFLPMLRRLHAEDADWSLVYGGRSRASMAFLDELAEYGGRVSMLPEDEHGLLDVAGLLAGVDTDTAVYCCGPSALIAAVEEEARALGISELHVEQFRPAEELVPIEDEHPFEVHFALSDVSAEIQPGMPIIEVAEDLDIPVMFSCSEGTCGTCETTVLEGEVIHRDSYLSEEQRAAGRTMMICVSRSAGPRLVLEL